MPVKISNQFNRPLSSLMNESIGVNQVLQVKLRSDGTKQIEGLRASYIRQSNIGGAAATAQEALANEFIQGRIVIVAEEIELSGQSVADLLGNFHPFQQPVFNNLGFSNFLFDLTFINNLDIHFDPPLEIADGSACSVLLSQGFAPNDTGTGISTVKLGCLNVNGKYKELTQQDSFYNFPR